MFFGVICGAGCGRLGLALVAWSVAQAGEAGSERAVVFWPATEKVCPHPPLWASSGGQGYGTRQRLAFFPFRATTRIIKRRKSANAHKNKKSALISNVY